MIQQTTIYITKTDRERLGNLIEPVRSQDDQAHFAFFNRLEEELEFAEIVSPEDIPESRATNTVAPEKKLEPLSKGKKNK